MPSSDAEVFLAAARRHLSRVLAVARGRGAGGWAECLVDAVDADTDAPAPWLHPDDGREMYLSNFANQQDFLRLLAGWSALTGEAAPAEAGVAIVRQMLTEGVDASGLPHWGGHRAIDLTRGEPFGMENFHELKTHFPYYEGWWPVAPAATRRCIGAFWERHILDWRTLDLNRHGEYGPGGAGPPPWVHARDLAPVFFVGRGLSFKNTGGDLFFAAGTLARLTGEAEPLAWAVRLAERYGETRHPRSGLSGYQYSRIEGDRAQLQFGAEFGDRAWEHAILDQTRATRAFAVCGLCALELGERLGSAGGRFVTLAAEDLRAWARAAYDPVGNSWHAVLRDGTRLGPKDVKRPGYYRPEMFAPYPAGPRWLWAYARAHRLTGDEELGRTAGAIARGLGLGDLGSDRATAPAGIADPWLVMALLEEHRRRPRPELLRVAAAVGREVLRQREHRGLFLERPRQRYARIGAPEPLVLLHLAAALQGAPIDSVPSLLPGARYFTAGAWQRGRTSDYLEWFPQDSACDRPVAGGELAGN